MALEQACKASKISPMPVITIFERDASPSVREALGYSFSLREHSKGGSGGLQVTPGIQALWMNFKPVLYWSGSQKIVDLDDIHAEAYLATGQLGRFCW